MWYYFENNFYICYSNSEMVFLVSNEVPEHPVISPVSGAIFEKRLIEKYLADNGIDPISRKELTIDQLIEVKSMYFNFRNALILIIIL